MFFLPKIASLSDERLLSLFRETKDSRYFAMLYGRYIYLLYGLCLNYLKTEADAQDAVMSLFEELQPKVLQYDIRFFKAWLYNVSKNYCLKAIRDARQRTEAEEGAPVVVESDDFSTLFSEDRQEATFHLLRHCLEQLSEPQRVSVELFFISDRSYADIARTTGFQLKRVKSYIQNGKRNLKICMERGKQ
ncbi:MAG: sigma-70 family RNA polymerase sigma factor [Prevotellaceae bacterium]|nr:sigma-70 family RNA polymerase sigma factor [Prevotellaceae bacterium]